LKNTNGYSLNAFLDFDSPLDILVHLMIGSEGTLGFIAEAVLHTLPVLDHKYTAQLYFKTVQDAAAAIAPLEASGARAAEIMDRAALRSVEAAPGAPAILRELPETAAAILVEYQAADAETLSHLQKEADRALKGTAPAARPGIYARPGPAGRVMEAAQGHHRLGGRDARPRHHFVDRRCPFSSTAAGRCRHRSASPVCEA
jgi:FAD/FMN-containing dehydrogenase